MTGCPNLVLLHTNVWLDDFIPSRTRHDVVRRMVDRLIRSDVTLLFAMTSTKDVYYALASYFKGEVRRSGEALTDAAAYAANEAAWGSLQLMGRIATPVGVDMSDYWVASHLKHVHHDYEDNLVVAAAQRAQADCLVTSDEALLRHAPLAAYSPEDMLRYMDCVETGR